MRRVLIAALIGGFIGFAVLLQIATDKAGYWSYDNFHCGNIVMLPVTAFKISDLMHAARLLIFQFEIVNSGFEFFIRGAGAGILVLTIYEGLRKRIKTQTIDSLLRWTSLHENSIATALWLVGLIFGCYVLLELLMFCMGVSYFALGGYLNATSIAIILPSVVLQVLFLAAAYKKKLFLWQQVSRDTPHFHLVKFLKAFFFLLVSLLGVLFACYFMLLGQSYWGGASELSSTDLSLAPSTSYKGVVFAEAFNTFISAWCACGLVFLLETSNFKYDTGKAWTECARICGFNAFLQCVWLHLLLPAICVPLFFHPTDGAAIRPFLMDVNSIVVAISTIPLTLCGVAVAFAPSQHGKLDPYATDLKLHNSSTLV